jgi:hypothetical protein
MFYSVDFVECIGKRIQQFFFAGIASWPVEGR